MLTANYHRNQAGMVAALKTAMAEPAEAVDMLHQEQVAYVLICNDDPQVALIRARAPTGLFSRLVSGEIPEFLEPIPLGDEKGMSLFRVL